MRNFFKNRFKIADQRIEICKACDKYEPKTTQCNECGCFMAAKTLMPFVSCPLDKWKAIDTKEEINKE